MLVVLVVEHFQYRQHCEHTCSDDFGCCIDPSLSFDLFMCQYNDESDPILTLLCMGELEMAGIATKCSEAVVGRAMVAPLSRAGRERTRLRGEGRWV